VGDKVIHSGEIWVSTTVLNVWEPGVFGWDVHGASSGTGFGATSKEDDSLGKSRPQELAALRRRESGRFAADVPGTEQNEAWASGHAPE
jgi:hypothetical protein